MMNNRSECMHTDRWVSLLSAQHTQVRQIEGLFTARTERGNEVKVVGKLPLVSYTIYMHRRWGATSLSRRVKGRHTAAAPALYYYPSQGSTVMVHCLVGIYKRARRAYRVTHLCMLLAREGLIVYSTDDDERDDLTCAQSIVEEMCGECKGMYNTRLVYMYMHIRVCVCVCAWARVALRARGISQRARPAATKINGKLGGYCRHSCAFFSGI